MGALRLLPRVGAGIGERAEEKEAPVEKWLCGPWPRGAEVNSMQVGTGRRSACRTIHPDCPSVGRAGGSSVKTYKKYLLKSPELPERTGFHEHVLVSASLDHDLWYIHSWYL